MNNMYQNVKTINPLCGECIHSCTYCSTQNFKKRLPALNKKYSGVPRLDKNILKKNLGKNNTWFICNMVDLFAENVPDEFIREILSWLYINPGNTYILQTKNPKRYYDFLEWFSNNIILATTIETDDPFIIQAISRAPKPESRAVGMSKIEDKRKMVTIEPIMRFHLGSLVDLIKDVDPEIVFIGADSKRHNLPEPSARDIKDLIHELGQFTSVIQKSNLKRLL